MKFLNFARTIVQVFVNNDFVSDGRLGPVKGVITKGVFALEESRESDNL